MPLCPQIRSLTKARNLKFRNFALTPTQHFPISVSAALNTKSYLRENLIPFFDLHEVQGVQVPADTIATKTDKTLLLYTKISILSIHSNTPKGFINRTPWEPNTKPVPLLDIDRSKWEDAFIPWTGLGKSPWIDIVVNNLDDRGHPFHLVYTSFPELTKDPLMENSMETASTSSPIIRLNHTLSMYTIHSTLRKPQQLA